MKVYTRDELVALAASYEGAITAIDYLTNMVQQWQDMMLTLDAPTLQKVQAKRHQEVFHLYSSGLTPQEVADATGLPHDTVVGILLVVLADGYNAAAWDLEDEA